MKRRINLVGKSTLTVSIPSKFVQKYELKKGDELEIREQGRSIILSLDNQEVTTKRGVIHLAENEPFLRRYLTALYCEGYDEVEITSEHNLNQTQIKSATDRLLGFELMESTLKRMVVRDVSIPKHSEVLNIFKRLFVVVVNIGITIQDDMKNGEFEHAGEIRDLQNTVHKLCNFCQRVLIRTDLDSRTHTFQIYHISSQLKNIGDLFVEIGELIGGSKKKFSKETIQGTALCISFLGDVFKNYQYPSAKKTVELRNFRDTVSKKIFMILLQSSLNQTEIHVLSILTSVLTCIKSIEVKIYPFVGSV